MLSCPASSGLPRAAVSAQQRLTLAAEHVAAAGPGSFCLQIRFDNRFYEALRLFSPTFVRLIELARHMAAAAQTLVRG